ncbi:hypothetical protein ASPCADRAFT_393785 [Aspergillus carbonarius ITEM 5010]|uniref:Glycoside hydrolase family 65 protein n=1 Tax=Aspergillus carbonarius (strain ITEM 5010) TaxID=602072 RepID=A0A1R3RZX0_ASPC5|nr:hypothetical protein ASPCADRAFT_393785 [Aspergillus carbonarius ITEM 5010]
MRPLSALTSLVLGPYLLSRTGEARVSPKSPPPPIIDRSQVVTRFNPYRNASSTSTPMQVGNGNFAFGADVTGLQTFLPYGILSSWGWHNSSLPANSTPSDFTGVDWWTHGRLVNYDMPNPAEAGISQWLIANPHRINLGRIGFVFGGSYTDYTEDDLQEKSQWSGSGASISRIGHSHRYVLRPNGKRTTEFEFTANFSPQANFHSSSLSVDAIISQSRQWWTAYWETGAFVDLTATGNATAAEIQRRAILSQYLLAVNEAGYDPPQESGLVNNGWYGKFHMEMYLWHSAHWTPWGKLSLLNRSIGVYDRFLPSSLERAAYQGYEGLRWGKMSDPSGRSAPGEINALLIWQQPHVFYFAETEYQTIHSAGGNTDDVLARWDYILTESAEFMASFAFWNASTNVYDLGPPMYPVSENTPPNATRNPTFELAYWHFGLDVAISWKARLGQEAPSSWNHVKNNLASLPTVQALGNSGDEVLTYALYEGIPNMWTDPETVTDHPALTGIYGLLPLSAVVNKTIVAATAAKVASVWNFTDSWGWDFPMLAMNAARLGDVEAAVQYLTHSNFEFDDVGMPVGTKAPTPYFPGSAALLLAVAMMTGGWDAANNTSQQGFAPGFPAQWEVRAEGFGRML